MDVSIAGHVICEHCNQPRSQHTAKFARCPAWAVKPGKPSTFQTAKSQPKDPIAGEVEPGPIHEDESVSRMANSVVGHFEEQDPRPDEGNFREEQDPESAESTIGRLAKELGVDTVPEIGKCFNCGNEVGKDSYCNGCKSFVCDDCDKSAADGGQFGPHEPADHLRSTLEDGDGLDDDGNDSEDREDED